MARTQVVLTAIVSLALLVAPRPSAQEVGAWGSIRVMEADTSEGTLTVDLELQIDLSVLDSRQRPSLTVRPVLRGESLRAYGTGFQPGEPVRSTLAFFGREGQLPLSEVDADTTIDLVIHLDWDGSGRPSGDEPVTVLTGVTINDLRNQGVVTLRSDIGTGPVAAESKTNAAIGRPESNSASGGEDHASPSTGPRALGPFDNGSYVPLVSGSRFVYSDGTVATVDVLNATTARIRNLTDGDSAIVSLRLLEHRDPAGRIIALDENTYEAEVDHRGRGSVPLLPGLLLGDGFDTLARVRELSFGTLGRGPGLVAMGPVYFGDPRFRDTESREPWRQPDGRVVHDYHVGYLLPPDELLLHRSDNRAWNRYLDEFIEDLEEEVVPEWNRRGISNAMFVVEFGVGWIYGRIERTDGTTEELWLEEWQIPFAGAQSVERFQVSLERVAAPLPEALIRYSSAIGSGGLLRAGVPDSIGGLDARATRREVEEFAGRPPDESRVISHADDERLLGTTQLVWFRHPGLPNLACYVDDGRLVSLSLRTGKLPPPRWWNPSFGPGLSLGGLEADFLAAGLISPDDRVSEADDDTRIYRAGRVRLEFAHGVYLDPRDNALPGFRLTALDVWTGP